MGLILMSYLGNILDRSKRASYGLISFRTVVSIIDQWQEFFWLFGAVHYDALDAVCLARVTTSRRCNKNTGWTQIQPSIADGSAGEGILCYRIHVQRKRQAARSRSAFFAAVLLHSSICILPAQVRSWTCVSGLYYGPFDNICNIGCSAFGVSTARFRSRGSVRFECGWPRSIKTRIPRLGGLGYEKNSKGEAPAAITLRFPARRRNSPAVLK